LSLDIENNTNIIIELKIWKGKNFLKSPLFRRGRENRENVLTSFFNMGKINNIY